MARKLNSSAGRRRAISGPIGLRRLAIGQLDVPGQPVGRLQQVLIEARHKGAPLPPSYVFPHLKRTLRRRRRLLAWARSRILPR
jgi:hypothetical protein